MSSSFRHNYIVRAMVVAGFSLAIGHVYAGTDNIGITTNSNATPQPVTAPTTGSVTFTASGPGLSVPTNFTYNLGTATWSAPAGWTAVDQSKGIFTNGSGSKITFESVSAKIAGGTATTPTIPNNSKMTNVPVSSTVLGASTANGSVTSLAQTSQPFNVAVAPNAGYATAQYIVQDVSTASPTTINTGTATAGSITGWTNPVVSAPASVATNVTVQSNAGPYQTGSYIIAADGSVTGNAGRLTGNSITFSTVAGTATVDNTGSVSANVTATPETTVSATGISTTGTLAVTGATTLTGALAANGGTTTTTLKVTGATTTAGITNTGNISNSGAINTASLNTGTLNATGNATVGGTLSVAGGTTTQGIANNGAITTTTLSTTGNATVGGTLGVTGITTTNGINNSMSQIRGVADGTSSNDAVNFGQLQDTRKMLSRGIASVTAMANVPAVDQGKTFSVGLGVGSYDSNTAIALGASYRVSQNVVLRGSVAGGSSGKAAFGAGIGASW